MAKRNPWRSVAIGSAIIGAFWWWRAQKRRIVDPDRPTPKHGTSTTAGETPEGRPLELKDAWLSYSVEDVVDLGPGQKSAMFAIKVLPEAGKEWFRGELTVRYHAPVGPGLPGAWSDPCRLFAWDKTPLPETLSILPADTVTPLQSEGCPPPDPKLSLRVEPVAGDKFSISLVVETDHKIKIQGRVDVGSTTTVVG